MEKKLKCMKCGREPKRGESFNSNKDKTFIECDDCMWKSESPRPTGEEELKERISEIFVKWGLPTRQVAINEILEQLSLAREEGKRGLFTKKEWDLILYAVSGNANEDTGDFDRLDNLFCDRYGNQLNEVTLKYDKLQRKIREIIGRLSSLSNQSKGNEETKDIK